MRQSFVVPASAGRSRLKAVLRTALQLTGCAVGFFVAGYTGALLTATNQPVWSDSVWIAPLFLTSGAATGVATVMLFARFRGHVSVATMGRLERAALWATILEGVAFLLFMIFLGSLLVPVLKTLGGKIIVIGAVILGLLIPLALHYRPTLLGRSGVMVGVVCVLLGSFMLRYGVLTTAPELLKEAEGQAGIDSALSPPMFRISPEDGRLPGGGRGADPVNRAAEITPRSKLSQEE